MSDELLPYFERELKQLTALGDDFATRHPQVASRLRLGAGGDPHVERLVQAVAFLNGRIRHKLDDSFPELTEAILSVLYPHYLRPIPSLAMVQMELDAGQHELLSGHQVPRGTSIETEPDAMFSERCQYRTAYDTTLWPLRIEQARMTRRPFEAPKSPLESRAQAVLHVRLKTFSPETKVTQLSLDKLRIHLDRGQGVNVFRLLEMLKNDVLEICLAAGSSAKKFATLPPAAIDLVGFAPEEALLPEDPRTFRGYRMLTEYFAFPAKHLFIDLHFTDSTTGRSALAELEGAVGDTLDLYVLLKRGDADLERELSAQTLRLGCTPIVNLFPQSADPFQLQQTETEYKVIPDARRGLACEIYSVAGVESVANSGEAIEYRPFFTWKHSLGQSRQAYWHSSTRNGPGSDPNDPSRFRREVFLTLVDLGFRPSQPVDATLRVQTTCFNGDAPSYLPTGQGAGGLARPLLSLPDGAGPVARLVCLAPPTRPLRPELADLSLWRLVSHLSLNHLSLESGEDAAAALREILQLYNYRRAADTQALIDSIIDIRTEKVTRRIGWRAGGFGRGLAIHVTIDESRLAGLGGYLLAAVLDRFLGLYVSLNSFTELTVQSKQRLGQEEPWKWPMRSGERALL
ncbi:MAG TPA: type VI secretion system baseplate subunit TssF [Pirellulaceae bacterium]|nr:type VI secretion system baseplate subunit TssF [Pirellulaceae bacterium]